MEIGIRLHDTVPGTLRQRLESAAAQGFSCAHLALSKTVEGFRMEDAPSLLTPDFAEEVAGAFGASGLSCAVLGCYLKLADPDPEERERTRKIYRAHLRFAPRIHALVVGTETPAHPRSRFGRSAPKSEEALQLLIDCLRPLVQDAEEAGSVLAIEPVASHIVSTPERAQRVLEAIPSSSLRVILDAVNLLLPETAEQSDRIVQDALSRLGDRISVLHLKDWQREGAALISTACGTGSMRYERLLAFARDRQLPVTLENTTPENAEAARLYLENC